MIPASARREVTVEDFLGDTGRGRTWKPPRSLRARVEPTYRIVRTTAGAELVGTLSLILGPGDDIPLSSRVRIDGRPLEVIERSRHDHGGAGYHVEVLCRGA